MKKVNQAGLVFLVFLVLLLEVAPAPSGVLARDLKSAAAPAEGSTIYLPLVTVWGPPPVFGLETGHYSYDSYLDKAEDANVHWVRVDAFHWDEIQPEAPDPNPVYHWEVVNNAGLQMLSERGFQVIAIIRLAPIWALKTYPGPRCGPIHPDALDEFAQFVDALVTQYSASPYNIKYWEFGNEPDIDPDMNPNDTLPMGCWGDADDLAYYGGMYYAELLKVVYPAIKAVDPNSKVLNGGLMLICKYPNLPPLPPCPDPHHSLFFKGVLENEGGDNLDIVSFHAYIYWTNPILNPRSLINFTQHVFWGDAILGKINYLKGFMAEYNVDKPLFLTETSLLKYDTTTPPPPEFLDDQATFAVWMNTQMWSSGIVNTIWYMLEDSGWKYSGMLNKNLTPKPVYNTYQFMTSELKGTRYSGEITLYPELKGYEFKIQGKRIWVLWAPDQVEHVVTLPANVLAVYDKFGVIFPVDDFGQYHINSPVFIELPE